MSESIFTKIINREVPGHFVYEDEHCVAIVDRFPAVRGQLVVIPKKEIDYVFDLDDDTYAHLFSVAKKVGKAVDQALNPMRTCLVVEGLDVPHVHIKIFPLPDKDKALGMLMHEVEEITDEEMSIIATQIQAAMEE